MPRLPEGGYQPSESGPKKPPTGGSSATLPDRDAELKAWTDREATLQREIVEKARGVMRLVPEHGPRTVYGHLPEWCALRAALQRLDKHYAEGIPHIDVKVTSTTIEGKPRNILPLGVTYTCAPPHPAEAHGACCWCGKERRFVPQLEPRACANCLRWLCYDCGDQIGVKASSCEQPRHPDAEPAGA